MDAIHFNNALYLAAKAANNDDIPTNYPVLVVRDIYGKLRFAINCERSEYLDSARCFLEEVSKGFGAFSGSENILFRDDFSDPDKFFSLEDWYKTIVPGQTIEGSSSAPDLLITLLDRQLTGQDWLRTSHASANEHPPRVVFYGIKGGVGRSSALAMLAYHLANIGKNVLLVDLDLESPGISSLLLPPERMPAYGLIDWFVEDAVGQGADVLNDVIADSPLADNLTGSIKVVPALGQGETDYLAKLARIYTDMPKPGKSGPEQFAARIERVLNLLEQKETPDIVLIDSRAGLHDLAAVSISRLASLALLFATDTAQNWLGYSQLFMHWQHRPDVLLHVRGRLAIVHALFPESGQSERSESFLQNSYSLFLNTLYDQLEPNQGSEVDFFSFGLTAEDAPHFPWKIQWNARLQEFNPLLSAERGGVSEAVVAAAFGEFFNKITSTIFGDTL